MLAIIVKLFKDLQINIGSRISYHKFVFDHLNLYKEHIHSFQILVVQLQSIHMKNNLLQAMLRSRERDLTELIGVYILVPLKDNI